CLTPRCFGVPQHDKGRVKRLLRQPLRMTVNGYFAELEIVDASIRDTLAGADRDSGFDDDADAAEPRAHDRRQGGVFAQAAFARRSWLAFSTTGIHGA